MKAMLTGCLANTDPAASLHQGNPGKRRQCEIIVDG
jgi:hypothetical protein